MKSIITVLAMMGALAAQPVFAAGEHQNKMVTCNKDATGKKGDERKAFMKECLSKKPEAAPEVKNTQQNKMVTCNKEATGKKGDERKKFMSECLKK